MGAWPFVARLSVVGCVVVAMLATGCGPARGHRGSYRQWAPGVNAPEPWGAESPWRAGEGPPQGWPEEAGSDEELLAPLLECASPAEFLQLQGGVNMAGVVERLEDWSAVRLGALGPVDARASQELTRKRVSFLRSASEDYGAYAEVLGGEPAAEALYEARGNVARAHAWLSEARPGRAGGAFARGLAFERAMGDLLRADAGLPVAQRRWLKGFQQPRIETNVGVAKEGVPGIRYADVLVIEQQPPGGQPPRVETFSFKSRNLAPLKGRILTGQLLSDANDALSYYGGVLDIRRPSLKLRVRVQRVRLVYQGGVFKPKDLRQLNTALDNVQGEAPGVEVLFQ